MYNVLSQRLDSSNPISFDNGTNNKNEQTSARYCRKVGRTHSHFYLQPVSHGAMEVFDRPYYKYQKYALTIIGQWPYHTSSGSAARKILILTLLMSLLQVQGAKLIMQWRNISVIIQCGPTFLTTAGIIVKFLTGWINRSKLKHLFNEIRNEWQALKSKDEIRIMEMYAERGKFLSLFYICMIYPFIILLLSLQILPVFVNTYTSFNMSGYYKYPYKGEYFVDTEKYFYYIVMHMDMALTVALTTMLAADVAFITIVLHACGMFGVVCYRLQHLFDTDAKEIYQKKMVANVVQYHRRILEYVKLINSCYACSFFIQFFLGIGALSILLVHITSIVISKATEEIVIFTYNICGHFIVVFLDILPGQMLLDCKSEMFDKVYDNKWYNAPCKVQMLLILIMHMCMRPGGINVANIFVSSFQIYATIVQSAVSYFMVLYSLQ